ncbi:hypothetical protein GCM10007100_07480 [Roseibacillus persicicus]|uniref:Uncharacterized protein n=1 Tax=Roseibacillus persicicus TaxID=454148 RepID=A0A918WG85_9BACT|nr:hypothetical protein GCM10007100_07480 [Roseibacillus persicicus]
MHKQNGQSFAYEGNVARLNSCCKTILPYRDNFLDNFSTFVVWRVLSNPGEKVSQPTRKEHINNLPQPTGTS